MSPTKKVKLLSGGNPQIAKADGDAVVQDYIAAMPGWKRNVGVKIDELITSAVPNVRKGVRWNSPFYGVEGQGWFLGFHCLTKYIKIAFFKGSQLKPLPPEVSKHEEVRYFHIHEGDWDEKQFTRWVKQASRIPGWDGSSGADVQGAPRVPNPSADAAIPVDLSHALKSQGLLKTFEEMPSGMRRFLIRKVLEAVKPETRKKRMDDVVAAAEKRSQKQSSKHR